MSSIPQALAALRNAEAALQQVEQAPAAPERLYKLADRPFGQSYWTLRRWAAAGRLKAHVGARRALFAWESDLRRAIEAETYVPRRLAKTAPPPPGDRDDPFAEDLGSGKLEASSDQ